MSDILNPQGREVENGKENSGQTDLVCLFVCLLLSFFLSDLYVPLASPRRLVTLPQSPLLVQLNIPATRICSFSGSCFPWEGFVM